jgi:membrane-bound serine protease (ClpP class)
MRPRLRWLLCCVALAATGGAMLAAADTPARPAGGIAYSIELNATIDPVTDRWIGKALGEARSKGAKLAIVRLDTPGGLETSMRSIIKRILAAPMPVAVYVSPNGARAGSAGVYITEAADVAAMAPETNIGSASPISATGGDIGKTLGRKIRNDAAAFIRALATSHGRNPGLAEQMVRKATNVTAAEAERARLIDVVASDQQDLLRRLDGVRIRGPKAQTLHTAGLRIVRRDMPLQYDLLELIVNPTVAFMLLSVGLLGLALEIFHPGLIAPGALGATGLLLGLYGTAQLPVTLAGVLLLALAVALLVAEAHLGTHGILGAAGVLALVASGLLLFDTHTPAVGVSKPAVVFFGVLLGGFFAFMAQRALAARRRPALTGWEEMFGVEGEVRVALDPVGQVFARGALWRATPASGPGPVPIGARVRVVSVDGLTLSVEPLEGPASEKGGAAEWKRSAD